MLSPDPSNLSTRMMRSLSPTVLARSAAAGAIALVGGTLVAVLGFLVVGLAFGGISTSPSGLLGQALLVNVVLYGTSALILLFGVMASASVHARAHSSSRRLVWTAVRDSLRVLPRVVVVVLGLVVALVAAVFVWLPISIVSAVAAAVLYVRHRRAPLAAGVSRERMPVGVRRALLAAIPLAVAVALAALLVAVLPAAVAAPRSIRELVWRALSLVRAHKRRLAAATLATFAVSALLSWVGATVATAIDAATTASTDPLVAAAVGTLAVSATVVLLMGACGAILAIAAPPSLTGAPTRKPREPFEVSRVFRVKSLLARRVAMVTVLAVVGTLIPATAQAAPLMSAEGELIAPALTIGRDGSGGSVLLYAEVTVEGGDPAGTVQFFDGTTAIGAPLTLAGTPDAAVASAYFSPGFDPGTHIVSFRYTPTSPLVGPGTSDTADVSYTAASEVMLSTTPTSGVGGPGHVEAAVVPGGNETTKLVPTGVVSFENNGTVTEVPLVDGVAALDITMVVDEMVTANYLGSNVFSPSSETVWLDGTPPVLVATTTTAEIYNPPHRVGADLYGSVQVSAEDSSDVRRGTVDVYAGTRLLASTPMQTVYLSGITVPTSSLDVGDVDLRFVYMPGPGYATSETVTTVTLVPAATTVALVSEPAGTVTWGDAHRVVAAVTSDLDGPRTLEVRDTTGGGNTLVASVPFTVMGGTASVPADVTRLLLAYRHTLRATVLPTAKSAAATSADVGVLVNRAPTTIALSTTGGLIGDPLIATAQVTSTAGGPLPGSVIFTFDGSTRTAALDAAGTATATFVPQELRTVRLSASYTNVDSGYAPSATTTDVTVRPVVAPAPIVRWYAANGTKLSPDDTRLELTYTAAEGRTTPLGTVEILDAKNRVVAAGQIDGGVVKVTVPIVGNQRTFTARYAGFSPYAGRTDTLPAPEVQNYTPTVTVTAPASVALGTPFATTVRVTDVPAGLIAGATLFATDADGVRTEIGAVELNGTGVGSLEHSAWTSGTLQLSAVVDYTEASDLSSTVSPGTPVVVRAVPIPKLTLSTPMAPGQLRGGEPVDLVVTAAILEDLTYGVPAGTQVAVVDETGATVGTTTLARSSAGLTGSLRIEGLLGGLQSLRTIVVYGPLQQSVLGAPLTLNLTTPYTRIVVFAAPVIVGDWTPVRFNVYPTYPITDFTKTVMVTVRHDGSTTTVPATANADGLSYSGLAWVLPQRAGTRLLEISTPGDRITMAPATLQTALAVDKRATRLTEVYVQPATAGFDARVAFRLDQLPQEMKPLPTGGIVVRDQLSGATCTIVNTFSCTLAGADLTAGSSTLTATYFGDENHDSSSTTASFVVAPRPFTDFDVTFSPSRYDWVSGQPVTVSWKTKAAGQQAKGRVEATIGTQQCSGPPAEGSCTITLPRYNPAAPPQPLDHLVEFIPYDDAPPVKVSGSTTPRGCVVISAANLTVDTSDATRCLLDGYPGVLTDSVVRFTPNLARGYVLDSWYINGVQRIGYPDPTLELRVGGALNVQANGRYSPKCVTVATGPARGQEKVGMGTVILVTPPNCANPSMPTLRDQEDWTRGSAQYAEGTVVELKVIPWRFGSAPYEVRSMTGSTQVGPDGGIVTTLAEGVYIGVVAEFEDPRCTPFSIEPSLGGSVSVTSTRPNESRYVKPYSGACVADDGRAGFIPGTQLNLTARADGGYGVGSFVTKTDKLYRVTGKGVATSDTVKDLGVNEVGTRSVGPQSSSLSLVTPASGEMRYGVSFNLFSCVAITTRGNVPTSGQELSVSGAEPCADIPSTRTTVRDPDKNYYTPGDTQVSQKTEWFVKSGTATVVAPTSISRPYPSNYGVDTFYPTWPRLGGSAVVTQGVSRGTGPTIDLEKLSGPAEITATYYSVNCMAPAVATPVGGSYTVAMYDPYIDCEIPRQLNGGRWAQFTADAAVGAPKLKPYFYNPSNSFTYEQFQESKMSQYVNRSSSYSLLYCSELAITSRIKEVNGSYSTMDAAETSRFLGQDGGCGRMRALPGRVVTTQMSSASLYFYRSEGNNRPQGIAVSVDKVGNVTGNTVLELQRICYSVDPSEYVVLITPPNCPGGNGRQYTKGTVVEVEVQPDGERFDGWEQIDQEYGASAWVVADRNRNPTADIHEYRWYETAINWVSNTAQRVVGGLMTIATGIVLGALSLLSGVSLAMKGISAFLGLIGVSGSFVDGLNFASKVVTAQVDLIGLAATCTNSWAGAEPITDLPSTGDEFLDDASTAGMDEVSGAIQDGLQDALKNKGLKGAAGAAGQLGNALTAVNTFASNTGGYSRPAVEGWNRFSSDMGDCLANGATDYGNAITGGKFE
jgi:hypothetical protein